MKTANVQKDTSSDKTVISQVDSLNVRVAPSLSRICADENLFPGTESKFLQQEQDWIQIQFGEMIGWVFAEYVTVKKCKVGNTEIQLIMCNRNQSNEPIEQIDPNTLPLM